MVLGGLSVREVAATHGVSRSWVHECLARYRADREQGPDLAGQGPEAAKTGTLRTELSDNLLSVNRREPSFGRCPSERCGRELQR